MMGGTYLLKEESKQQRKDDSRCNSRKNTTKIYMNIKNNESKKYRKIKFLALYGLNNSYNEDYGDKDTLGIKMTRAINIVKFFQTQQNA
ncbi:hypothetical protein E2986_13138 [Frieseomelitta varia]|uniref:Uncharacterized protein n=1 Tax=Frieseomelitta varia TaxID=561572 RepID=A0A833S9N9_9HYME|nr:hypothetical protein E2986_13138 [Frieseomelitta varia]